MRMWSEPALGRPAEAFDELNKSLPVDRRLAEQDILASQAWAGALERAGVLSSSEAKQIQQGLKAVLAVIESDEFEPIESDEDIHTLVERLLTEEVGQLALKLHTGRSRNDQVATDFRMWVLGTCTQLNRVMNQFGQALVQSAEDGKDLPLPGYTHLQQAQPVTWDHWILSHFWPLMRDLKRVNQVSELASVLPLGSGALAGTSYAIDRETLAETLGFERVSQNSIDGVSDRDFALEFSFCCAMASLHLSRLAEMLILFGTAEFGFIKLPAAYTSGSSLMPQKRNPDALELVRAKSAVLIGKLAGSLASFKALPSAYDKDLQEDKLPVFEAFDTLHLLFRVMAGLVGDLRLNKEKMEAAISPGSMATDVADYLVARGVPFRHAHQIVSQVALEANQSERTLADLSSEEWLAISDHFEADVMKLFDVQAALERRTVEGGTSKAARQNQLTQAKEFLEKFGNTP